MRAELDAITPRQRRVMTQLEERGASHRAARGARPAPAASSASARRTCCAPSSASSRPPPARPASTGSGAMARATRKVVEHLGGVKVGALAAARRDRARRQRDHARPHHAGAPGRGPPGAGGRRRSPSCRTLVRERKPHVLLTEARMPDAPGARFCSYLRRHDGAGEDPDRDLLERARRRARHARARCRRRICTCRRTRASAI